MEQLNTYLFRAVNSLSGQITFLDKIMIFTASYIPYIVIAVVLYVCFRKKSSSGEWGSLAFFCASVGIFCNTLIKFIYFHPRPFMENIGYNLIEHASTSSFPSDHGTFLFTISLMLLLNKETRITGLWIFLLSMLCAFARIYCGVHYPFDMLGAILVSCCVCGIVFYFRIVLLAVIKEVKYQIFLFFKYLNDPVFKYRKYSFVVYTAGLLIWFLTALYLPLVDPSEGRYALIADHMAKHGSYIIPYIMDNGIWIPFMGKPPLYFWCAALSIKLFGPTHFAVRIPNILASVLLLVVMFAVMKKYKEEKAAYASTVITMSSGLFFIVSACVLVDVMLTFFTMSAFFLFYAFLMEKKRKFKIILSLGVSFFLALAFLTKGPVALVLFGLPVFLWILLGRKWSSLKNYSWIPGISLFCLIVFPWFIAAENMHPGFINYFFVNENIRRFISADYGDRYGTGHIYPHGMSVLFFLAGAEPWGVLLLVVYGYKLLVFKNIIYPLSSKGKLKNYFAPDKKSLFFLYGFVSVVIFWGFAKQLQFYYLITVIPPFSVWCTLFFLENKIKTKVISLLALVALGVYGIIFLLIPIVAENKIPYEIIRKIKNIQGELKEYSIIFIDNRQPSVFYYGGKAVIQHHGQTFQQLLRKWRNCFYVIKTKDYKNCSMFIFCNTNILFEDKNWTVLVSVGQENLRIRRNGSNFLDN